MKVAQFWVFARPKATACEPLRVIGHMNIVVCGVHRALKTSNLSKVIIFKNRVNRCVSKGEVFNNVNFTRHSLFIYIHYPC